MVQNDGSHETSLLSSDTSVFGRVSLKLRVDRFGDPTERTVYCTVSEARAFSEKYDVPYDIGYFDLDEISVAPELCFCTASFLGLAANRIHGMVIELSVDAMKRAIIDARHEIAERKSPLLVKMSHFAVQWLQQLIERYLVERLSMEEMLDWRAGKPLRDIVCASDVDLEDFFFLEWQMWDATARSLQDHACLQWVQDQHPSQVFAIIGDERPVQRSNPTVMQSAKGTECLYLMNGAMDTEILMSLSHAMGTESYRLGAFHNAVTFQTLVSYMLPMFMDHQILVVVSRKENEFWSWLYLNQFIF